MKLKLSSHITLLEIFYDGECALCCRFSQWLQSQETLLEIRSIPYQSNQASQVFPSLASYQPETQLVTRVNSEHIYQGAEGWVLCLWSCKHYRVLARLMSTPILLPLAKKLCYFISKNRRKIS